jgi:hypothetical protein
MWCGYWPMFEHTYPFLKGSERWDIGTIARGTRTFRIQRYEYDNPESNHGNHRLLIFESHRYFGSYDMQWNDECRVNGNEVLCRGQDMPENSLPISEDGPACEILFGGDFSMLGD